MIFKNIIVIILDLCRPYCQRKDMAKGVWRMEQQHGQYAAASRGHKTKGNSYKHRYVEKDCPECGHHKAYKDTWRTKVKYTCLKRVCRHVFYENIQPQAIDNQQGNEQE